MRRDTKRKDTKAPEDAVPAEFIINDLDLPGAYQDLGRELKAGGIDTSGRDKVERVLRPATWSLHLIGGGATADREHLAGLRLHRQETAARAADLEARGERRGAESVRSGIAGIDRDIAKYEALVAAAGDAASHDQAVKRARLDTARRHVADLGGLIEPYQKARIMSAERTALEDRLLVAERAEIEATAAWDSGRREFEAAGAEVQKLTGRLYAAIVAAGETLCGRLGKEAGEVCAGDLALFARFPNRAPDQVIALAQRAERVSGLMETLGSGPRRGLAAFWDGCADAAAIIAGKIGVQAPGRRERVLRRRTLADMSAALGEESRIGVT